MPYYNIDEDVFVDWLVQNAAASPGATIGVSRSALACPVAEYVRGECGHSMVSVMPPTLLIAGRNYWLPAWAVDFANYIDQTYRGGVTAEMALEFFYQWHNNAHGENIEPDGPSGSNGDA